MDTTHLESLYGPLYPLSDHKVGDSIMFYDVVDSQVHRGTIEWVQAPGVQIEGGTSQPVSYVLDTIDPNTGMPYITTQADLVEHR